LNQQNYIGDAVMSSRHGPNELKIAILEKLQTDGTLTSRDVSTTFSISIHNASNTLKRLQRQALVTRNAEYGKPGRPTFTYEITSRGVDRVDYLAKKKESARIS